MNCVCGNYISGDGSSWSTNLTCSQCGRVWKQTLDPGHIASQAEAAKAVIAQLDKRIAILEAAVSNACAHIIALEALVEKRLDPDLILEAFAKNLKGDIDAAPPPDISIEDIPF